MYWYEIVQNYCDYSVPMYKKFNKTRLYNHNQMFMFI